MDTHKEGEGLLELRDLLFGKGISLWRTSQLPSSCAVAPGEPLSGAGLAARHSSSLAPLRRVTRCGRATHHDW